MKSIVSARILKSVVGTALTAFAAVALMSGCAGSTTDSSAPVTTTLTETRTAGPAITSPPPAAMDVPATEPDVEEAPCGSQVDTTTIDDAIAQIAPPMPGVNWVKGESNAGTCSLLVFVALHTQGGTGSSPNQLLLFRNGDFLGTGTACNLSYQMITGAADDQIDVRYSYIVADEPNAAPQGEVNVAYRWNGSGIDMIGELPEAATEGKC
ncbi:LppP/LprE family lipoprotein [Williamsia muralis]|uniref:LppP/LprE family lipoprotein n=1 Tax=Williamsia marianensis TaxID=85044 RepID=UPI003F144C13